jgi:hypothetical protein
MTAQRITVVLRRAEAELCLAGESKLAGQVASVRRATCALVSAVQREREASTPTAQETARMDAIAALADLGKVGS